MFNLFSWVEWPPPVKIPDPPMFVWTETIVYAQPKKKKVKQPKKEKGNKPRREPKKKKKDAK